MDASIIAEFLNELEGYLPELRRCLDELRADRTDQPAVEQLHRISHTIKGAAAMVGLDGLSGSGDLLEKTMENVLSGTLVIDEELLSLLGAATEQMDFFCQERRAGKQADGALPAALAASFAAKLQPAPPKKAAAPAPEGIAGILDQLLTPEDEEAEEEVILLEEELENGQQRQETVDIELLACFAKETEEHSENIALQLKELRTAVRTETGLSEPLREHLHLLRHSVHTIKGAAAVIGIETVAAWGHQFEDFLDWLHDESPNLGPQAVAAMQDGADILARLAEDSASSLAAEEQAVLEQFQEIMTSAEPAAEAGPSNSVEAASAPEQPEQASAEDLSAAEAEDIFFSEEKEAEAAATFFDELTFADSGAEAPTNAASDELEDMLLPDQPSVNFFTDDQGAETADDPADDFFSSEPEPAADDIFSPAEESPASAEENTAASSAEAIDPELLECFAEESGEHLENIDLQLRALRTAVTDETPLSDSLREPLHSLRRSVHTLKGAAAVIGIETVAAWGHQFEDFLDWLHDESPTLGPQALEIMQDGADILARLAENPAADTAAEQEELADRFQALMTAPPAQAASETASSSSAAPPEKTEDLPSAAEEDIFFAETAAGDEQSEDEPLFDDLFSGADDSGSLFAEKPEPASEAAEEAIDPELLECFTEETGEHLENIDQQLREMKAAVTDETPLSDSLREPLHSLRRSVHTLKGAAAVIGIETVAAWGHQFEDFLDWLHDESPTLGPQAVAAMQDGADLLVRITEKPAGDFAGEKETVAARFSSIMAGEEAVPPPELAEAADEPLLEAPAPVQPEQPVRPVPAAPAHEPGGGVRKVNTLRVEISKIDQVVGLSGDMVINLSSFEASMSAMSGTLNELGMILQRLKSINHSLEAGYELATIPYLRGMGDSGEGGIAEDFDPLEMDRYSELNILIRSLSEAVSDLDSIMNQSALENVVWQKTVERQARVLKDVQNKMIGLRMTPLSVLSARMHRTVREAGRSTGHPAELILEGESIMMDTRVWDTMADALMHILRNSVAHGGSPERQLTVEIKAERRGGQFSLRIKDDGKGLNYEAIRAKGMKLYPLENVGGMSNEKLASLIFRHGFSSAGTISGIAGRGVGMDVVRDAVELLNGSVEISSSQGEGLELLIRLPVAVAQLQAVLVRLAGQIYAVPMHDISSAARIRPEEITGSHYETESGGQIPLIKPAAITGFHLGPVAEVLPESEQAVLLIRAGNRQAALFCEQIIGQRDIVFKDLGSHLHNVSCIAGMTIMGDGSLVPILQSDDLLTKWTELSAPEVETAIEEQAEEKPLQVLVVDDSISVRKVVSNFLSQQGWLPSIARNGIEALERIREERPDLVLLDVEMPRMNGFEVLQALQSQPDLQDIPVVMLTSRSADKYREKASQLGARGFMTKPFKEDEAIELIRRMTSGEMMAEAQG